MTIMAQKGIEGTLTGEIYLDKEHADKLERLEVLKPLHVFIIQRKASVNYFSTNIAYEIMDVRRNVIFKASKPKPVFSSKRACKISVRNLRNVKLFSTVVEPSNFDTDGTEASVYLHPNKKIAHVEKYGGKVGPPCYELFNADRKTAFTIDHSMKKNSIPSPTTSLDYDVSTKGGTVANILMKTGLNVILSTDPRMPVIEKATLIGVILAMDLLKTGSRESNDKEPACNQYSFN